MTATLRDLGRRAGDVARSAPGGWPVAAAVAAWAGATVARPIPVAAVPVTLIAWLVLRRRLPSAVWWCLALAVAADVLAIRALAGLDDVVADDFAGPVTLVTDPRPTGGGRWRFEVDTDAGHLLATATNPTAVDAIADLLAGQRLVVAGRVAPFGRSTDWLRSRHLAGELHVESVHAIGDVIPPMAAANAFRDVLDRGAATLSDRERSLLSGLVIGDDRDQPPELTADFRASGLTHLLAVSGQNLVFVLAVGMPLLRRLRLWPRYIMSVALIVGFAMVTRFEPSVVRAAGVAVIALFATTIGRPGDGVRHLALAVCGLLLVDPLLVGSLGFRLSVAASLGVLAVAPPIVSRVPGPRWLRDGMGITAGAQIAVAPVIIPTLGPMPVAALPANLMAGPIAGLIMVWGLTAGTVAGMVGGPLAVALHLPTRLALGTMETVARWSADLPLGRFDLRHVAAVAVAAAAWRWVPRSRPGAVVLAGAAFLGAVIVPVPHGVRPVGIDAEVWVDGPVAVVVAGPRADPTDVLDELRRSQVLTVGLVVLRSGRSHQVELVAAVAARYPVGAVIGPPGPLIGDLVTPPVGARMRVGRLLVVVDDVGPPLRVRVGWA